MQYPSDEDIYICVQTLGACQVKNIAKFFATEKDSIRALSAHVTHALKRLAGAGLVERGYKRSPGTWWAK